MHLKDLSCFNEKNSLPTAYEFQKDQVYKNRSAMSNNK